MAFASLNLSARIWKAAGLRCILSQEDLPAWSKPEPPQRAPENKGKLARKPLSQNMGAEKKAGGTEEAPQKSGGGWKPIPIDAWPQIWRQQLARVKKGRFAWTYMRLGADMTAGLTNSGSSGRAGETSARRECLRRLLRDLNHPAGTHTFWPIALPEAEKELVANTGCFWSGLHELGCRGVIIMGSGAAWAAMGTKDVRPLDRLFKYGKLIWIIHDPLLINSDPVKYDKALAFLRRSLKGMAGL